MWEYYPTTTVQVPTPPAMSQPPANPGSPWMQSSSPANFNSWDQFPKANQGYSLASDAMALQGII